MGRISDMVSKAKMKGYSDADAQAKVCQDIILEGIGRSSLSRNATIKGGVVMRSLSDNVRRATQDMDIDFIRYSLADESIERFISKVNCIDGLSIHRTGPIEELKQQDYHGKRVYITISDESGDTVSSKIDVGIHKNMEIEQEEYCFDIASFEDSVNLLINTKEQMFTEKLRSLLKFGTFSTRYKDIFDMCYLADALDKDTLLKNLDVYIFNDSGMRENSISDVVHRAEKIFMNKTYLQRLSSSNKNWLGIEPEKAANKLLEFLHSLH